MGFVDARGCPVASGSTAAVASCEQALWRMMSFYDVPLADLDRAAAEDPHWALPPLMKAGFLLSLTEPSLLAEAGVQLAAARDRLAGAGERERVHLQALEHVTEGRWRAACQTWDAWLVREPGDALALQWAQLWDFYRGDATQLRQRPARALPAWRGDDPLHPYVLGLYAFGLEECNLYAQAEDVGRAALAANPRGPWAIHAVAHVMEMQGRFEEGAAWLRQHQGAWTEGNGFACHLYWHKALFRLEGLDRPGAWRLIDSHLSGEALQITLQRLDAAALLWRLALLGDDVSAAAAALADGWPRDETAAGYYAFNDVHLVMALLAADRVGEAEGWTARCASRALAADDARRTNHQMARDVGLPLMRALIAFGKGEHDAAAQGLFAVRTIAQRFGGSHAQRDLIDQTALAAAARGSEKALGRALLNERRMAKPVTPLTRHWMQALGQTEGVTMNAEDKRAQRLQLMEDEIGRRLAESEASGELRTAPSYGKPLRLADGYEETPAELRLPMKILKDAGILPPEIELMHQIAALQSEVDALPEGADGRDARLRRLSEMRQALALRLEALGATGKL